MRRRCLAPVLAALAASCTGAGGGAGAPVDVFAAASLKTALDAAAAPIAAATGATVRFSYAASSALARQIEDGAPADVFISADVDWMDYVDARGFTEPRSRVDIAANRLVLIAPADRPARLTLRPGADLRGALGGGRLTLADPVAIPAGRYARAALESLGVWADVADRLAPADHVRAALVLVARGEAPLGIVYYTDAIVEPGVVIVDTFAAETHPEIVYPAALTGRAGPGAARVLDWLAGDAGRRHFERHGFIMPRQAR